MQAGTRRGCARRRRSDLSDPSCTPASGASLNLRAPARPLSGKPLSAQSNLGHRRRAQRWPVRRRHDVKPLPTRGGRILVRRYPGACSPVPDGALMPRLCVWVEGHASSCPGRRRFNLYRGNVVPTRAAARRAPAALRRKLRRHRVHYGDGACGTPKNQVSSEQGCVQLGSPGFPRPAPLYALKVGWYRRPVKVQPTGTVTASGPVTVCARTRSDGRRRAARAFRRAARDQMRAGAVCVGCARCDTWRRRDDDGGRGASAGDCPRHGAHLPRERHTMWHQLPAVSPRRFARCSGSSAPRRALGRARARRRHVRRRGFAITWLVLGWLGNCRRRHRRARPRRGARPPRGNRRERLRLHPRRAALPPRSAPRHRGTPARPPDVGALFPLPRWSPRGATWRRGAAVAFVALGVGPTIAASPSRCSARLRRPRSTTSSTRRPAISPRSSAPALTRPIRSAGRSTGMVTAASATGARRSSKRRARRPAPREGPHPARSRSSRTSARRARSRRQRRHRRCARKDARGVRNSQRRRWQEQHDRRAPQTEREKSMRLLAKKMRDEQRETGTAEQNRAERMLKSISARAGHDSGSARAAKALSQAPRGDAARQSRRRLRRRGRLSRRGEMERAELAAEPTRNRRDAREIRRARAGDSARDARPRRFGRGRKAKVPGVPGTGKARAVKVSRVKARSAPRPARASPRSADRTARLARRTTDNISPIGSAPSATQSRWR